MRKPKTYYAEVLDESGSMDSLRQRAIDAFNQDVAKIREEVGEDQEVTATLVTFANVAKLIFFNADLRTLKPLTWNNYKPGGLTALFDGVILAINTLQSVPDANDPNVSFLVKIITDGEENNSTGGTRNDPVNSALAASKANLLLRQMQRTDRWTFAFQLPPGTKASFGSRFGVPSDNLREWEATEAGIQQAAQADSDALEGYFRARRAGRASVSNFYVTTDLSTIDHGEVKKKLDDISDKFTVLTVLGANPEGKEYQMREFIEEKTKKLYVIGSAYYQLMKTETVQPGKRVLIMEKGKKAIWGGKQARKLIGLPDTQQSKVTPGNHSNYDIFVESRSVNRKLPRGTKVLVDNTKTTDETPTWDHTASV